MPDHADLCVWFLERLQRVEDRVKEYVAARKEMHDNADNPSFSTARFVGAERTLTRLIDGDA